jgi:hypothetical protein
MSYLCYLSPKDPTYEIAKINRGRKYRPQYRWLGTYGNGFRWEYQDGIDYRKPLNEGDAGKLIIVITLHINHT